MTTGITMTARSRCPGPGGDDAVAYCMQTYRSYDPRSGTYLGNDGYGIPARNRN